ncbi:MAG TPA: methylmalonyl-CoA mutase family protein [Rhizobiaceae bacterium]|nr:methylmalonyl-CoA mutase family protein [Rhizobiaceae bacterium]
MDAASLFAQTKFPELGQSDWRKLAEKALAGASFDALVSRTDDGIGIDPHASRAKGATAWTRGNPAERWIITQRVDDPDPTRANRQALEDIEGGATGLSLVFEGAPNAFGYGLPADPDSLRKVLEGIQFTKTHLRIDVHPSSRASVDWLVAALTAKRIDPTKLSLAFGIDPAAIFAGTGRLRMSIEALKASMPQSLAHFFALDVPGVLVEADGRVFHNAGATEAQELGILLATAVSHLRMFEEARQPLVYAAPHIGFALSVDQDQFLSMAKIRALRKLWTRVQEACSIEAVPCAIHAETSYRMLSFKDPETNILRSTIAAFAAGVGGADSISILPHTLSHGLPDAFARRVARNTHAILTGESHVDHVADPIAGAGSVEALTNALCERAWVEFQRLEAEGGVLESLVAGKLQDRVVAARGGRAARYSSGERAIIGTTKFPAAKERPVAVLETQRRPTPEEGVVFCTPLQALRIDETIAS